MIPNSEDQHRRMTKTPIPRLVLSMAAPTVASQMVSVVYNTADTWFVSQIGTSAAAAVGVVFSLMSIIQAFGFGFGMGASSLISRQLGARDDEAANRYGNSAFCAALLFGFLLLAGGLLCLDNLLRVLGSTETVLPYARDYARYILLGAPIMCASFVLSNILRAEGEAVLSMWGLCTGGLLNLGLDPLLIFGLRMGIGGAAVATVASQCVSFLILLGAFLRGKSIVRLGPQWVSRDIRDYLRIIRIGLPTICRQGMASLAAALMNIQASPYGDAALAAITISNKVYLLVRNLVIGIGQGFQPVAGYNYGAGNRGRVREAFRFATLLGTAVCVAAAAALAVGAETVLLWFRDDPAVVEIGAKALRFACFVLPFMAYSTYVNQLYQCLGFSKQATFLACCRQGVFYLPLIFLLPWLLGLTGVQMTQPASDFLTFLISVPFQIHFYRRRLS
ncbi:MAG: MATE family efflux transporter [Oscillospiraceae bacterium]|nr:MATE family efflux transporter [Oscillospiraceae bacterium]